MKKILFITLLFQLSIFAHTVLINSIDNDDGTMDVEGMFSTGTITQGATLRLQSLVNKKILYEDRIPSSGTLTMNIPKEPYMMILDCGPGHIIKKKGYLMIKGEDSKNIKYEKPINYALFTTLSLCIGFILLSFMIHFKRVRRGSS